MNADYDNITSADLWFACLVWLGVGIVIGLAVSG